MEYTKGEWEAVRGFVQSKTEDKTICQIPCDNSTTEKESKANAHLIAAAPDMYEALKNLHEKLEHSRNRQWRDCEGDKFMVKAKRALAKAEGRE